MKEVYINRISKFLPNDPVDNETMEQRLGQIDGRSSRARAIVLRNNRITSRYYAIDEHGEITHNNAQLTKEAISALCDDTFSERDIDLISCGTSSPDQILPSHASMVHGFLKNGNIEVNSPSGACCTGMSALKFGFMSVRCGQTDNAVCAGSERTSSWMRSSIFEEEVNQLKELEDRPILAFEKEFLRWMLSDGAGAMLLESQPKGERPLRIDWMEGYSYAGDIDTCMYAGGEKMENGQLKPWSEFPSDTWGKSSLFAMKQDIKLLNEHVVNKGVDALKLALDKNGMETGSITYYLPHISSYFFYDALAVRIAEKGIEIPMEKWFTNLDRVGNIGAASIYVMLEELLQTKPLKKGDKIILHVPESARFSYSCACLTVC